MPPAICRSPCAKPAAPPSSTANIWSRTACTASGCGTANPDHTTKRRPPEVTPPCGRRILLSLQDLFDLGDAVPFGPQLPDLPDQVQAGFPLVPPGQVVA